MVEAWVRKVDLGSEVCEPGQHISTAQVLLDDFQITELDLAVSKHSFARLIIFGGKLDIAHDVFDFLGPDVILFANRIILFVE